MDSNQGHRRSGMDVVRANMSAFCHSARATFEKLFRLGDHSTAARQKRESDLSALADWESEGGTTAVPPPRAPVRTGRR